MADAPASLRKSLADRYRLDRELGQGGMATVYLAHDLRHDRDVAVKVLRPELAVLLGRERFLSEIRLTAKLDHPHILTLIDSGETDGFLWYVLPLVRGESLREELTRVKQLGVDEALALGTQIAGALDYAHRQGVIHRDLKPENILLHEGEAMLSDFGIALAVSHAGGSRLTETGLSLGTPQYMSPEQATGDRDLDCRTDVYSLAAVLYEMLAGEPPHAGPTAQAVIAKLMATEPVRLGIVRPALAPAIEQVIHTGLNKVREDRYPTAGAMLEALRAARAEAAVPQARPRGSPTGQLTRGGVEERRWIWATGLLVLLVGLGYRVWHAGSAAEPVQSSASDARRVAVLYFNAPDGDSLRLLADGLTEGLISALSRVPELDVISPNGVAPFRRTNATRDSVARALRVGTLVEGGVEAVGTRVRVTVRLVDAASGAEFQRASFEPPAGAYLVAADSLAEVAASFLRERLGSDVRLREQRSRAKSVEAWVVLQRAERARQGAEEAAARGDSVLTRVRFSEADSFARLASAHDPEWSAPILHRARVLYRRSRLALATPFLAKPLIEQGITAVDSVLRRDNTDPDALELRGNLQYWKYLLRLEQDPAAAATLRTRARKDLEEATRLRPSQAGAWASLSHLYANDPTTSMTDVMLAARRAYESDAYLENAPKIIERLFWAGFDLDQPVDAAHWCEEGSRRFPDIGAFTTCQLYLMTMRGQTPDPAKAWRLAQNVALHKDPTGGAPAFQLAEARLQVAGVLARAGLRDSARAVARSSVTGSEIDPTRFLYLQQAAVLVLADDKPGAIEALKTFLAANPERLGEFRDPNWQFRSLMNEPAFRDLVGRK